MHWIDSHGGPLVLIPEPLIHQWLGADGPSLIDTHYERACALEDYVGVVPLDGGSAVVLGDEPLRTAWRPAPDGRGGLLVRWISAPAESDIERALDSLPRGLPWEMVVDFDQIGDALLLFDAAVPGTELPDEHLRIALAPGRYAVSLSAYHPSDDVAVLLHRVTPA